MDETLRDAETLDTLVFKPYRWTLATTGLRVLLYPVVVIVLFSGLFLVTGNSGPALVFVAFVPGIVLPIFVVVAALVLAGRSTRVIADQTTVTRRWLWTTRQILRSELASIDYGVPLRGALPCRFRRTDGRVAFQISVSPWRDLQPRLEELAAFLRVPLKADTGRVRFRL